MKLVAIDYKSPTAAEEFVESLRQTGFGVLKNHPIQQSQVSSIYQSWEAFFNSEQKSDFVYHKGTQDGFFPQSVSEVAKGFKKKDIKEYYHYYPWGQCPTELKAQAQNYYDGALSLAIELLNWIEEYSPSEVSVHYKQTLSSMIADSDQTLLRILHYPPLHGNEESDAIRAAAHEDINLITILPAANEPGLQVKSMEGEWLDVPSDFGNLIVNIGDMLQEASGHYFPSTTHRVVNPVGSDMSKARISLPLFLHPSPNVELSDKYTAKSYLNERLKELGVI
ncbi:2OG-Fe(II) oxygenase family protein [Glaciecola petra]|uniref:2-oxoglutarate-dependent ethylene/succinate-forming enzyme n=1 Tax=Glaciecola petra TaxID=3075602 RepID=A0ABU2ZLD1_9ALTE|nr:2OG-Fe(II) oxygenase family protein [Aestuariibacter sp. P117]MDT0593431.1 2OG-Fe(II) oxygenase family protein [Aestuariibacter sp. P117]